jgi:hypothetical protein
MPRVNRAKKYELQVRFLTETMNDKRVAHKHRMVAAMALNKLFERLDRESESARLRRERRAAEKNYPTLTEDQLDAAAHLRDPEAEQAEQEEQEEARIQEVFATILQRKPEDDA